MSETNYLEFIETFNRVHKYLIKYTRSEDNVSFSDLLYKSKPHPMISLYLDELHIFRKLRNIIVHQTEDFEKVIATPSEETVKRIKYIESQLVDPATMSAFKGDIHRFEAGDRLKDALLTSTDKGFLKFPTYEGQKFAGLVTSRAIAKWLQQESSQDVITLDEKMSDLLPLEGGSHYEFVSLDLSVYEAWERFKTSEKRLGALLATKTGREDETIEAIVTHEELITYIYSNNLYVFQ